MAGGSVHIPWYATGFRGDDLARALEEIAPIALRYGASAYSVYRYRDDRYKFLQVATFPDKDGFTRYWEGPEFVQMRSVCSSFYQVPVLYGWTDLLDEGFVEHDRPHTGRSAVGGAGIGELAG